MAHFTLAPAPGRPDGAAAGPRVAVLGDVGGHSHRLRRTLEKDLGVVFDLPHRASPTGHDWWDVDVAWPADLTVIQVGDLVHRGPDSPGVLQLVARAMAAGVWVQVAGNHEQLYVGPRTFAWHETLDAPSQRLLQSWWEAGTLRPAAGILTAAGPGVVVTHAGLTAGFHTGALGRPGTAAETVAAVNRLAETGDPVLWRPGMMLDAGLRLDAGPLWAEAGHEVYTSWLLEDDRAPYAQVHGHSSAFDWARNRWYLRSPELFAVLRPLLRADTGRRHVTAQVAGVEITGVDPGHGRIPSRVWAAKVFHDARVL